MRNVNVLILLSGLLMVGCKPGPWPSPDEPDYAGRFPTVPVNLGSINSEYDDYNSYLPYTGTTFPLVFSSNRNSDGKNFDFIFKYISLFSSRSDSTRTIKITEVNTGSGFIADNNLIDALAVNSPADEFGPYMIKLWSSPIRNAAGYAEYSRNLYCFLYATNQAGNLDIRYVENVSTGAYGTPKDIDFLNSAKDDAYPSVMADTSAIYFCSNREGSFDIFRAAPNVSMSFRNMLQADSRSIVVSKDTALSSPYEDKCPFIQGNLLVFTSNRPGGYGGFDLYYSKRVNGQWTAPVNFGAKINSSADEYRPIVPLLWTGFENNMMIFSSNRAGGKGGFDLYYVGIDQFTR